MEFVELVCLKQGSKLRVRIITSGYYNDANCQFPKDLRVDKRKFRVRPEAITLITSRGKYYYCVKNRADIVVVEDNIDISKLKIFTDEAVEDCLICLSEPKSTVLYPCGHFYMCGTCSKSVKKCPICRADIKSVIEKTSME